MENKNKIIEKLKKFGRIFERKFLFYALQIIVVIISIVIIKNNFFISQDIGSRGFLNKIRNSIIENEINQHKKDIIIVGLDEKFFRKENMSIQGLHRGYYAQVLKNIQKSSPSSIGIDVFFQKALKFQGNDTKTKVLNKVFKKYDKELGESLKSNTILASTYDFNKNKNLLPAKMFIENSKSQVGHIHSNEFQNKINLGIYPQLKDKKNTIKALSLKTFSEGKLNNLNKTYNISKNLSYKIEKKEKFTKVSIPRNSITVPHSNLGGKDFLFTPIYEKSTQELKSSYISFYDVYKNNFNPQRFKDKIVLIGATDPSLQDIKMTIGGNIPGVFMHANSILSFLAKDFIYVLDKNKTLILVLSLIIFNFVLTLIFKNTRGTIAIFYLLIIEFVILLFGSILLSLGYFNNFSVFLPLSTILLIIAIQLIMNLLYVIIETYSVKENFKKLFNLYVGDKLENKTKDDIDEIGQKMAKEEEISIFFSDIEGFTELSEKLSPSQNISFLNEYLEEMSKDISQQKGFIDKYIGDAIMAFWEESNGSELAAKSAINNILSLDKVNKNIKNKIEDENIELNCRIGLNYGKSIVGDIGAKDYKLNYTIIGDNVNLAARLEGVNKFYGTQICMSENFLNNIKHNQEFLYRKIDKIIVKGKSKPIEIYELLPYYKSMLSFNEYEKLKNFIDTFGSALDEYILGNFKNAKTKFNEVISLKNDKASKIFIERCEKLIENPPNEWNGVREFKEK